MPNTKLGDLYNQLKQSIVGTKTQQIDNSLDKAVKDIVGYKSHSGRNGYIDLVKSIIGKATTGYTIPGTGGGIYTSASSGPAAFGQAARLMRYKLYESIVSNINYAHRALKTIVDNILAPDDITKVSLEIKPKKYLEDEIPTQAKVRRVKEVVKLIKLEEKLDIIVWNTILFGDFFCEIAQTRSALTSRSMINEAQYLHHINTQIKSGSRETWTNDYLDYKDKKRTIEISIDYTPFIEEQDGHSMFGIVPSPETLISAEPMKKMKGDKKEKKDLDVEERKLKNLSLVFHRASCVIKLQSSLFPLCFGYLVFPQIKGFSIPGNPLEDEMVNNICRSILSSLEKKIPQMAEFQDNEELQQIIFHMVKKSSPMQALEIRFVPPDKMIHFMVPSTKYYPYGESLFDASQYSAKVLMALETSLAIQRLSRSTEKRKIAIEIGLPRDAKKAIESMKEEFRKRKISLDSFGTIDTIPSMITTFEDVYIPQKDGKPFVDISSFDEGRIDTRGKVDELKFMRDQLTANWGVPPSFLGIEENLCCDISNTYIPLLSGETISLKEVIRNYQNNVEMWVYSYDDEKGKLVPAKIKWAGETKLQTKIIRVWLDNEKYVDCTPEHPFMLRDGTYIEAKRLLPGMSLMPFYTKRSNSYTSKHLCCDKEECKNEIWYERNKENKRSSSLNHKVVRVEELDGLHDTGDITVENYHNFAVDAGVIIHNSNKASLSEENIIFARSIITHQKYLNVYINELIDKIFKIVDPEEILLLNESVLVTLPGPKTLQYERESRFLNEVIGLIESLERIGVPREYSKKKYLPQFDWDEIKKYEIDSKVEKNIDPTQNPDQMGMGMGGGMGGFGGGAPTGGGYTPSSTF